MLRQVLFGLLDDVVVLLLNQRLPLDVRPESSTIRSNVVTA